MYHHSRNLHNFGGPAPLSLSNSSKPHPTSSTTNYNAAAVRSISPFSHRSGSCSSNLSDGKRSNIDRDPVVTPYVRRITELQVELDNAKNEIESLRNRELRPIGNLFSINDRQRSPWLGTNRESALSARISQLETQLTQAKEEMSRSQARECALEQQLEMKCKDYDEKFRQQLAALRQRSTEVSLLSERNELLKIQLEKAQKGQIEIESAAVVALKDEHAALDRLTHEQEQLRYQLEQRERKVLADREKLKREYEAVEMTRSEAETALLTCKETAKEIEKQRQEVELREEALKEAEARLTKSGGELEELNEHERLHLKSERNEIEGAKQKLKKTENELQMREKKLKQREAELGRTTKEMDELQRQLNELKSELEVSRQELEKERKEEKANQRNNHHELDYTSISVEHRPKKGEENASYWKKRYEDSILVQRTLEEQLKTAQAIQASQPLTQHKRKAAVKTESDGERTTRSTKAKDVAALKDLIALQEKEKAPQPRERSRRRRKDSDSLGEESIEIPIEPPAGGSRRGRKRQASPDVPRDLSSSPQFDASTAPSPSKRRRYDSGAAGKDSDAESIAGDQRGTGGSPGVKRGRKAERPQTASAKKPPRPRTRAAVESDCDAES